MYSPKIKPELVTSLYHLKHNKTGKPMTFMVNEAVIDYINKQKQSLKMSLGDEINNGEKTNELEKNTRSTRSNRSSYSCNFERHQRQG